MLADHFSRDGLSGLVAARDEKPEQIRHVSQDVKRPLTIVIAVAFVVGTLVVRYRSGEHRQFEEARARLNDGVTRTVILGDSVARGAGDERGQGIAGSLDRQLRILGVTAAPVANLGINGARTNNVRRLLSGDSARRAIGNADVVVVSIGGNDLYGDSLARLLSRVLPRYQQYRTIGKVQQLVSMVQEANPAARIYVLGLYNPYRHSALGGWLDRQVNLWDARLIACFAPVRNVTVIRICDLLERDDRISAADRFHPGAAGYEAIATRIAASM